MTTVGGPLLVVSLPPVLMSPPLSLPTAVVAVAGPLVPGLVVVLTGPPVVPVPSVVPVGSALVDPSEVDGVDVPEESPPPPESQAAENRSKEAKGTTRRIMEAAKLPHLQLVRGPTASHMNTLADGHETVQDEGVLAAGLRRVLLVGVGLLAGVVGPGPSEAVAAEATAAQTESVTPSVEAFAGHYVYVGGEAQRTKLLAEIDAATEDLNVALRGIARRRIWKSQQPSRMMTITVDGDKVSITRSGGKAPFVGTIGHGSFPVKDDYRGTFRWRANGTLVVDITGGDQHTQVRFTLDPEKRQVTMRTTIEHDMLPRAVHLKKTFRAMG